MPNKRKATKRKRELQKARAVQKKLKERYKNRYGAL